MRPLHWASQHFRVPKTEEGDKGGLRSQKSAKNPILFQHLYPICPQGPQNADLPTGLLGIIWRSTHHKISKLLAFWCSQFAKIGIK